MGAPGPGARQLPASATWVAQPRAVVAQAITGAGCLGLVAALLIFLVSTAVAMGITQSGSTGRWIGALVTVVLLAGMVAVRVRTLRRRAAATQLTADATGLRLREPHATRHLAWSQITGVAPIPPLIGYQLRTRDPGRGWVRSATDHTVEAVTSTAPAQATIGFVGTGDIEIDADAPAAVRGSYLQAEGQLGTDPNTGVALIGLSPDPIAERWDQHELIAWVRQYRPDLLDSIEDLLDPLPELPTP